MEVKTTKPVAGFSIVTIKMADGRELVQVVRPVLKIPIKRNKATKDERDISSNEKDGV